MKDFILWKFFNPELKQNPKIPFLLDDENRGLSQTVEDLGHLKLYIPETLESMLLGSIHMAQD